MTTITVRDIPVEVRDRLAAQAAYEGRSLQEHLKRELIALADRPSMAEWLADIRELKTEMNSALTATDILTLRDADRR